MDLPLPFGAYDATYHRPGTTVAVTRALPEETAVAMVYDGTTHAVMMATPADIQDFALGFSLTEGIVSRPDQIERAQKYGAIPSYLTSSIVSGGAGALFLWGGERGNKVMAAHTLEEKGMPFTFSHDAPVTPKPWILPLVDAGVNRAIADGTVIGEKERVSPYVALKAVTSYAAFQIKEEKTKGTLEQGKLADLVILEANPLKVDPTTIKDIKVLETIKEGKTVYERK